MGHWLMVVIGAAIGYLTNAIAIRMAFLWLIPRKQEEMRRGLVEGIKQFLPKYLQLPLIGDKIEKDIERIVSQYDLTELGKQLYRAGRRELLGIELLGALVGALVGLVGMLL